MDKEQIEQLLNETIEAYHAQEKAEKAFRKWIEEHVEPEPKNAYELIDDSLQFIREHRSYKARYDKKVKEANQAKSTLKEAKNRFDDQLPALVWFKVGSYGVGLSYDTNYHVAIEVEPWSGEMPRLDYSQDEDQTE